ncbi:MAG: hypothetical protein LUQ66_00550 [Methanoregula sp.]|nr:hypothetical protein [Methanoregula sp.]
MEKRNIIGITLIIGIVVVILLLWGHNNIIIPVETNKTTQPITVPESQSDQVMGKVSHSITLEKSVKDNVGKIMVYKTVPQHYTRQDILTLAKKFNISPIGRIKEVAEGSSVASFDGKIQAILHNSGFAEYHNSNQKRTVNSLDVPGNFPSDDEAVKIATKFLKDQDLLPDGAVFSGTTYGEIHGTAKDGTDIVFREDIEVWFGRELNGIPVEGTQLMLAIGADGTPIDYFTNWRNYEQYKEMLVKTPEQAFEDLKVKGVSVGMNVPDKVTITNMYLAYRTKAGAETEEYLEPVWVFKGDVIVNDKSVMPIKAYIPALTDESVKSLSS